VKDKLTHLDARGRARMVDVGGKEITHRVCVARCEVHMAPETLARIVEGDTAKGDVLATARIAGIQAAKRTGVETHWRTGVEMEALVAASAAGLTVYDMCKAVDRGMSVEVLRLVSKSGGRSGTWTRPGEKAGGAE